jgi:tripeptidyl-peptidase-2
LVRALIAAKAAECDLINLSCNAARSKRAREHRMLFAEHTASSADGEPFWRGNGGRVADTFSDAVRSWGVPVFVAAGNQGPALSTLGAPSCVSAVMCVGAYISPAMMKDQYSMCV